MTLYRSSCTGSGVPCEGLLFQRVRVPSRQRSSRPGSYPSDRGGNEAGRSLGERRQLRVVCELARRNASEHRGGPERHDAKADPAWTGGRLVRVGNRTTCPARFAGVVGDSMPTRSNGQHGKPALVTPSAGSTDAYGAWPKRVAEGLGVPKKPGNAGGGKGPWFQGADGAARDRGDWR